MLNSDFMELESQRRTLEEIIEVLKQDQINLIEICGMRGIGKTTMVTEVVKRVKEENLFDEVCLLDVLGELNPGMIRQRVMDNFDKADMTKERKILVALDNIGVEFNARQLRTPWGCSHRTFKILFTSKIQGIWRDVPYKKEITLGLLSDDEALKLFTFKAEFLVDTLRLRPLAKEIVNVCGGLPHLLVTIRCMVWDVVWDGHGWPTRKHSLEVMRCKLEDMLESLTSRITNPFPSMALLDIETASSNYKEMDRKARGLFLFCCLFGREKSICVEDLARCAMIVPHLHGGFIILRKAREEVYTWVDYLKEKYFLRDGKDHEHVAVPALVCPIGIFVASSGQGYLVRRGAVCEWNVSNDCSYISLISGKITELPARLIRQSYSKLLWLECSELKSLDLHKKWELRVLFVKYFNGTLTLPSPSYLEMLALEYCPGDVCKNITGLGYSNYLKTLSFRGSGIVELVEELRNLPFLELLDLRDTYALNRIPPVVIKCLFALEELYLMGSNFVDWEGEGDKEGRNANLKEFENLIGLRILQIYIRTDVLIPELEVFSRLKEDYGLEIERVIS